jgi:hypothetical protein
MALHVLNLVSYYMIVVHLLRTRCARHRRLRGCTPSPLPSSLDGGALLIWRLSHKKICTELQFYSIRQSIGNLLC